MGQIRFGRSHRGIREISWNYNDMSLPDSTGKVALRGLRGCSMPFYGVPGLEAERSQGSELDKSRMYFRFSLTLPSLLSRLVVTLIPGTMRTPPILNSGLDPFPESTACPPSPLDTELTGYSVPPSGLVHLRTIGPHQKLGWPQVRIPSGSRPVLPAAILSRCFLNQPE